MNQARQDEATRRAARAHLRRAIRDELAGRNDSSSRQRRSAALMRQVRRVSQRTTP